MKNIDTSNLTAQQHADITALYNTCREQHPHVPAYFLWLLSVEYFVKDVIGKKQRGRMHNKLIDEKVNEMRADNKSRNHTNILKLMSIEKEENIISNVIIE